MDNTENPETWRDELARLISEKRAEKELIKKIRRLESHTEAPVGDPDDERQPDSANDA